MVDMNTADTSLKLIQYIDPSFFNLPGLMSSITSVPRLLLMWRHRQRRVSRGKENAPEGDFASKEYLHVL